ncbi:MAG: acyl carrier protein [Eggerthellaceae bacterium]|nr:acyl carrier protein [Eggerthellaceae bacterium]
MASIDTIKAILEDKLDINPADVNDESTFDSLGIDSLDMVELICELEDQMGIDFGEPDGITTVADLVAYLDTL